jgi:hypothetical protein
MCTAFQRKESLIVSKTECGRAPHLTSEGIPLDQRTVKSQVIGYFSDTHGINSSFASVADRGNCFNIIVTMKTSQDENELNFKRKLSEMKTFPDDQFQLGCRTCNRLFRKMTSYRSHIGQPTFVPRSMSCRSKGKQMIIMQMQQLPFKFRTLICLCFLPPLQY